MKFAKDRIWAKNVAPKIGDSRFVQMLSSVQEDLFIVIMSLTGGDLETSKDCLQETNVALWQSQEQFDPHKGSFINWAKAIAFAKVRTARLQMSRSNKRFVWDDETLERIATSTTPACDNRTATLYHCLKALSKKERSILRSHYLDGIKIKDLAIREHVSEDAMYKYFSRLRKSLANCMLKRSCKVNGDAYDEEAPDELSVAIEELFACGTSAESALALIRQNVDSPTLHEALFVHALLHWDAEQERNRRQLSAARRSAQLPRIAAAIVICSCGVVVAFTGFSRKPSTPAISPLTSKEEKTEPTERINSMNTNATIATLALTAVSSLVTPQVTSASDSTILATYNNTIPTTRTKLFSGVSLADVKSVSGMMVGALANGAIWAKSTPWHFKNDGSKLTAQFQVYLGDYTKCIMLTLEQDGNDIYGTALPLYYNSRWENREGMDFTSVTSSGGYTFSQLSLSTATDDELRTNLWWNGADGATWNAENTNWLDANGNATTWLSGARACFTNANAQTIVVADGIVASHMDFAGNKITFSGSPLELVGTGELVMRNGGVRFENPISGDSGLRLTSQGLWSNLDALTTQWQVVFPNAGLGGMTNLTSASHGKWSGANKTRARAYHVVNDGKTMTAQMQFNGGPNGGASNFKCVFLEMQQNGPNVEGRITAAKYFIPQNQVPWGMDFSQASSNIGDVSVAESVNGEGYGIGYLEAQSVVELAADNTYTRETRIDRDIILCLDGGTLGGGTYDYAIINYWSSSLLDIRHTHQTFTTKWGEQSYDGKVLVKGNVEQGESTLTYLNSLPENNNKPITIFRNTNLANWVGVDALFTERNMSDAGNKPAFPCFFRNDGNRALVQFQRNDDVKNFYTKCAIYEFKQEGKDIVCQRLNGCYAKGNGTYQYLGTECYNAQVNDNFRYSVSNLVVRVKDPTDTSVTFEVNNQTYKGGLTIDGAAVFAKSQNAIPSVLNTTCVVTNHAKLFFDTGTPLEVRAGTSDLTNFDISDGSFVRWCHYRTSGINKSITSRGECEIESEFDSYFSHLTLEHSTLRWTDHADYITRYLRAGFETNGVLSQAYVKVRGIGESRIEAPIALVKAAEESDSEWLLDIADTNGDTDWDLIISEKISDFTESAGVYAGRGVRKIGNGTLAFTHTNTFTGQVSVAEGTLALAADNALNTNNVVIGTATIDAISYKNGLGTLNVNGAAKLILDQNSQISFKDSSSIPWTGQLEIDAGSALTAGMLRFGTDANALTAEQISRISCNGRSIKLDANGYAIPPPTGTVIMLLN